MNYDNLVMTTAAIAVGSAEIKSVMVDKKLAAKPVVAGFALGIFLFIIGMASPKIGSLFCYFIIITALLVNGEPLFKALQPSTETVIPFPKG